MIALLNFVLTVLLIVFKGFVVSVLFNWFAVPTFGLPELGIVNAIGLSMLVNFVTFDSRLTRKEVGKDDYAEHAFTMLVVTALMLFFGWIIHLFM